MKKWHAIIFDFDGVLADSVDVKTKAFEKLFESYGPDIVKRVSDHHQENGGMSRFDKFQYYFNEFIKKPLSTDEMDKLSQKFSDLVVDKVVDSNEIEGAGTFLEEKHKDFLFFVNSATPQDEIKLIVERRGWSNYFKEVLGSPRTKKQNTEFILKTYNLNSQKCLFIGDAISDYKAALETNVNFFGISQTNNSPLLNFAGDILWGGNFKHVSVYLEL